MGKGGYKMIVNNKNIQIDLVYHNEFKIVDATMKIQDGMVLLENEEEVILIPWTAIKSIRWEK